MIDLKSYFHDRYKGGEDFVENVILPIFGEDKYEDAYGLDVLEVYPEYVKMATSSGISQILQMGTIHIPMNPTNVFDITVFSRVQMERNRVNIQQLVRNIMGTYSSAFMVFHYDDDARWDWRFTFCSKFGSNQDATDSKRYTFLLGPNQSCRTAADNFKKLADKQGDIELQDIVKAFDVESLSMEFFEKYKVRYGRFVAHVIGKEYVDKGEGKGEWKEKEGLHPSELFYGLDEDEKVVRDYVKKLLGRIVFLHFLQKKGWLGATDEEWTNGSHDFMFQLFDKASEEQKDNFLDEILEPLFSCLDTPLTERREVFDTKVDGLRSIRVPFLGGLFERTDEDKAISIFPRELFADLFEFLSQYNFTIDENDPNDAQVGVDPEMLGRIFENLLEDNKDKGAFYTPKEIVQYMCRESLIAYLQTGVADEPTRKALAEFVRTHDVAALGGRDADLAQNVSQCLRNVKICDPAIGSGAFPMGLLNELFMCRGAIEDFSNAADIKRHIIQQNIYGVDIEKGAVEIARLRFWLSLIIDAEKPDVLPNMDFKIMQGNSLLEQYRGFDLSHIMEVKTEVHDGLQLQMFEDEVDVIRADVKRTISDYFTEKDHDKRRTMRRDIQQKIQQQINAQHFSVDISDIKDIAATDQFFLWHTWFSDVFEENGGFDIVIGNPPYLRIQGIRESNSAFADYLSEYYTSATGSFDLYVTFAERGLNLINHNGVVNYIMPTKWTNSAFGKGLRKLVSATKSASKIIDFGAYQVFNASTYTGLQWFAPNSECLKYFELNRDLSSNEELSRYLNSLSDEQASMIDSWKLSDSQWVLANNKIALVLNQLDKHPRRIKDVFDKIFQGLATSKDDVYFIHNCSVDEKCIIGESKQLERKVQIEKGLVKPLLKGEDVHRYDTIKTDRFVIFPYKLQNGKAILYKEGELSELYPLGYAYLKECEAVLREREKGRFNIDGEWFQFGRKQGIQYAEKEKLVAPEISLGGNFAYDDKGEFYSTTKIYGYIKKDNIKESYKFWMALFNSRLFWFFIQNTGYVLRGGYFTFKTDYINPFPVPGFDITCKVQTIICQLVDFLIFLKNPENKNVLLHTSNDRIMAHISEIIDLVIYELYFEQHMKDNNLDVISFLKSYPWNCNIVDMSEDIEKFYLWYQQSDNPIRQRSMLLETRSKNLLYLIHKNQLLYEQNQ